MASHLKATGEKRYSPFDRTLRFVDKEDELDFLCEGFTSLRALMSCGHAVTPMSLTNWCRRLLDQGESSFVCGQRYCNVKWPYEEVRKMALLTSEEKEYFERKMACNAAMNYFRTKSCPKCKSCVARKNDSDLRVHCTVCTANNGLFYEFCWQCLRDWKSHVLQTDRCGNDGCSNEVLKALKVCPEIIFQSVKGVTGCPSFRACPTCGVLVEHDKTQCKNVICPRCKVEFCFVCLKLTKECLKTSRYFTACEGGVAPRQTSLPVWQKQ